MQTCYPVTIPVRTTEPTFQQEPITVAEAKDQCGVAAEVGTFDSWFAGAIVSARLQVEHDAGVICYTGTFTWKLTEFPYGGFFELPSSLRPVTAVGPITYVASDGTTTTLGASTYALKETAIMPHVALAYGQTWPSVRGDMNGITVSITAGYATVLAIPQPIKTAVKLAVHIEWLLRMEQPDLAMKQQAGYDRWLNLLRREMYS